MLFCLMIFIHIYSKTRSPQMEVVAYIVLLLNYPEIRLPRCQQRLWLLEYVQAGGTGHCLLKNNNITRHLNHMEDSGSSST